MSKNDQAGTSANVKRLWPIAALAAAIALFFALGGQNYLSFDAVAVNYGRLTGLIEANPVLSALAAIVIYALATAFSIPAGLILTVTTGLLFGWLLGGVIVVIGATLGASALFLIARYALNDFFTARAGDWLNKMAAGFRNDAVNYMLFLRLVAVVPFALVNFVPAVLGVPFVTYVWTTAVGIIPGTIAYAYAGEGLRSIVADRADACLADQPPCGEPLSAGDLVTPQILIAFALLAIVALLPAVLKRLRGAKGKAD